MSYYVCGRPTGASPSPSPSPTPTAPDAGGGGGAPPPPGANPTPNPDVQPPKVTILNPTEGAKVGNNLTLNAQITDDIGVVKAELFLDNKLLTSKGAPPWSFPVVLPAGKHTLRLEGRDQENKMGSAAVTVTVEGATQPSPAPSPGTPATPPSSPAPATGGYGELCTSPSQCNSSICANDLTLGKQYCTRTCDPATNPCPVGSDCYSATSGTMVCAPLTPQAGAGAGPSLEPRGTQGDMTCSMGDGPVVPDVSILLLIGLGLILRARRVRR